jgi:hypothetical protein
MPFVISYVHFDSARNFVSDHLTTKDAKVCAKDTKAVLCALCAFFESFEVKISWQ